MWSQRSPGSGLVEKTLLLYQDHGRGTEKLHAKTPLTGPMTTDSLLEELQGVGKVWVPSQTPT